MEPRGNTDTALILDRLGELANVGAGHAADALAQLLGCSVRMAPPRLGPAFEGPDDRGGIVFDVLGEPGGRLHIQFPPAARRSLLAALPGREGDDGAALEYSALVEVGNVLASHALGAVGDLAGTVVLPSVPRIQGPVVGDSEAGASLRIETDLVDAKGTLRGRLVWLPHL